MSDRTLRISVHIILAKHTERADCDWDFNLNWPLHRPVPTIGDVLWLGKSPLEVNARHHQFARGEADIDLSCRYDDKVPDGTAWFKDLCAEIERDFPSLMAQSTREFLATLTKRPETVEVGS